MSTVQIETPSFSELNKSICTAGVPAEAAPAIAAAILEWTSYRVPSGIRARAEDLVAGAGELLEFSERHTETFISWRGSPGLASHYEEMLRDLVAWGLLRAGHDEPRRHAQRPGLVTIAGLAYPAVRWSDMPTDRDVLLVLVVLMLDALGIGRETVGPTGGGYDIAGRVLHITGLSKAPEGDTKRQFFKSERALRRALEGAGYHPSEVLDPQRVFWGYDDIARSLESRQAQALVAAQ